VFDQALVELSQLTSASVVRAYDFSGLTRIVDVGGGYGELLIAFSERIPRPPGCCLTCRTRRKARGGTSRRRA